MGGDDNQAGAGLPSPWWQLWVDGTALPNPGRMSIGLVLAPPQGADRELAQALNRNGCNNEAELRALIAGLELAREAGAQYLHIRSDSDFVVSHVRDATRSTVPRLTPLLTQARQALAVFAAVELDWIPRHRNPRADALARSIFGLAPKTAKVGKESHRRRR
ncbi:hypothetical protein DLREEDagrD3_18150 [Denitratisoma sp. agr-D3]